MKPSTNQNFLTLQWFIKNHKRTSCFSILIVILFLNSTIGCSYYNVRNISTTPETMSSQLEEFNQSQKYVVIHSGPNMWHLNDFVVNEDNQTLSGSVEMIAEEHIPLKSRDKKRVHRYTINQTPLNEVHFYVTTSNIPDYGSKISIPFSEITNISVNDKNTGRSIANAFVGTIGILAGIFIIALALKGSCPFVYVKDGEEYVFTGELYPGVITPNQQRDDYLQLPNTNVNSDEYSIKITNELKEIQFTDVVQLVQVNHPKNIQVLLDKNGNLHTFSKIVMPNTVSTSDVNIDKNLVLSKDNQSYLFDSHLDDDSSIRDIKLDFDRSQNMDKGKLFLTLKNSMWLDYVFGKFNEKLGTYYPKFQKDQQKASKEKSDKWIQEQNIPLSVYLKTSSGWDLIDKINTVGPMAFRDIAVPIDLKKVEGNKVQIKLETGFMFWEVDYVGMDFTENVSLDMSIIAPKEAWDENGVNILQSLSKVDKDYFVQPNIGDEAIITFKVAMTNQDVKRTFFLKNRGFYNYIRDYKGTPNFQKLKLFREAGVFTDFSMYEYEALMSYQNSFDSTSKIK